MQERSLTWFDRIVRPLLEPVSDSPTEQNIGNKLMAKMGFTAGEGLGRDGTGMKEAIQVKQLEEGAGLGYSANPVNSAVVSSRKEVVWFTFPGVEELVLSPVEGRRLSRVTNSRFLSVDTLEKLNEAQAESTVIRRSDLNEVAKSVHAYYAVSAHYAAPVLEFDTVNPRSVQLEHLNKLTSFLSDSTVAADLSPSIDFHSYLSNHCHKVLDSFECDPNSLDLITFDTSSKKSMLENVQNLLNFLKSDGNCVLHCLELQDRFTVSIIYILTRLFQSCSFIKTEVCCPHTPDLFFVAKSFIPSDYDKLLASIQLCLDSLCATEENNRDILEILSISYLFQPDFYQFLSGPNEKVSLDAFDTIIDLEKMNHSNSFPSGRSTSFITKYINERDRTLSIE
jgi:hypothetical protein